MKRDLFVTAGEVAQDLGVSKPFAYKLVRQMSEELEAKGFITIAGRVSRKYYEEHRDVLALRQAAKKAFDEYVKEHGKDTPLPRLKDLHAEYAQILERKRKPMPSIGNKNQKCRIILWHRKL